MHIPDGYLSPKTCIAFYGVMLPVWYVASRKAEKAVKISSLPLLALTAAFAFVVMMFNVPVPGGSTGHMVGTAVVAITLGPWASIVAISLTGALQALAFGDGGLTTLGANTFNMAFLMSIAGYFIYETVGYGSPGPFRKAVASGLAGYAATNISALSAGIMLGVQPLIASGPDGRALYFPYPLSVSIPAMAIPHLLFFGPLEALGTALAVPYMQRVNEARHAKGALSGRSWGFWALIIFMIMLAPVGLIATGSPWGEWSLEEFKSLIGYVPDGMRSLERGWRGILPEYGLPSVSSSWGVAALYAISALFGSAAIVFLIYIWGRIWPGQ